MSDKIIKQDLISGDELVEHYRKIKDIFGATYNDASIFPNPKEMFQQKDARIMFYVSVVGKAKDTEILSCLIKDNNNIKSKELSSVRNYLRESLFINIFLRFENFIRIIAENQGIKDININRLSKKLIRHLKLNNNYENLIDIFTYIRNTIHTEGIHSNKNVSITYKDKTYDFKQDEPIDFIDNNFITYLFTEVNQLVVGIINADEIKNIPNIPHNILGFTYEYE